MTEAVWETVVVKSDLARALSVQHFEMPFLVGLVWEQPLAPGRSNQLQWKGQEVKRCWLPNISIVSHKFSVLSFRTILTQPESHFKRPTSVYRPTFSASSFSLLVSIKSTAFLDVPRTVEMDILFRHFDNLKIGYLAILPDSGNTTAGYCYNTGYGSHSEGNS